MQTLFTSSKTLFTLLLGFSVTDFAVCEPVSSQWLKYKQQKHLHQATTLPDYSYAGYRNGESSPSLPQRRIHVRDYGAMPNDNIDDRLAIQKTINVASRYPNGATVLFSAGKYLINTNMDNIGAIKVNSSHVVLKGAGSDAKGTVIHSVHPTQKYRGNKHDRSRLSLLQRSAIMFFSTHTYRHHKQPKLLTNIVSDSASQSFSVKVSTTEALDVGDTVLLYSQNKAVFNDIIHSSDQKEYFLKSQWTSLDNKKKPPVSLEIHEIVDIQGDTVFFKEPIRFDIKSALSWSLREHQAIRSVGLEDMTLMGSAHHRYKHHRSSYDNRAWSMLSFKGVRDAWARRVRFINTSHTLTVERSSNVSALNLYVQGNPGHHLPRVTNHSHNVLMAYIYDLSGFSHGPTVMAGSAGSVFWRCFSPVYGSIDAHAGRPLMSLYDEHKGGSIVSGGGVRDYPHHLNDLTLWNFEHLPDKQHNAKNLPYYDFWPSTNKGNFFFKPHIIGMHGLPANVNQQHVGIVESHGKPVQPQSLYQAQLLLRLGESPTWLTQTQEDHQTMMNQTAPDYLKRHIRLQKGFLYTETFSLRKMLDYVASLSLQMYNSPTFKVKAVDAEIYSDQGMVRNTLWSLMLAMHQVTTKNNWIIAEKRQKVGRDYIVLTVMSTNKNLSKEKLRTLSLLRDSKNNCGACKNPYLNDAITFSQYVGGHIKLAQVKSPATLEAWIPQTVSMDL